MPLPPRTRLQRLRLFLLLGGLSAFGPLSIDMYLPAFPELARRFHAPETQVQVTLTACVLGLALGQLLAGPVSDSLGRRRPLLVGLAAYALASLACVWAPSVYSLAGLRFVQGFAGAAGIVISRAVVADVFEGTAAIRIFSRLVLVSGLAPILAPLLGGQVLRLTSWHGVFLVLAAYGLILLGAIAFALPESLPPGRRHRGGLRATTTAVRSLLAHRRFVGFSLAGGLAAAAMFTYIAASPFVLQGAYGVSPQLFGVLVSVNALGLVGGSQLSGFLVRRRSPRRLLAAGLVTLGIGAVALAVAALAGLGLGAVLGSLFLVVSSLGFVLPNATALAMAERPDVAGTASALVGVLHFLLGAVAAPLVGLWSAGTALPMAVVIGAFALLAALSLLVAVRPRRAAYAAVAVVAPEH